jgi:hypothetical protein
MRGQLQRLIDTAALPNVTLQVLPFSAGAHAGMDGEFTIFSCSDPADPDVVFIENSGGDLYLEHAGSAGTFGPVHDLSGGDDWTCKGGPRPQLRP